MDNRDIITSIRDSGILDYYKSRDEQLRELLQIIYNLSDEGQRPEILFSKHLIPATEIEHIYRRRLKLLPPENVLQNAEKAEALKLKSSVELLVHYCQSNPQAYVNIATFVCPHAWYAVFCGVLDEKLETICAIKSKDYPGDLNKS